MATTAVQVIILIGALIKELGTILVAVLSGKGASTPEEARQHILEWIKAHDDAWLEQEIDAADDVFNQP